MRSIRSSQNLLARGLALSATLACVLGLSGCYVSADALIDTEAAVHPLPDGVYGRQGDPHDRFRLTLRPDGAYEVERLDEVGGLGESHQMWAAPSGADFILAEEGREGFVYGVARLAGARLYLAIPDCADPLDRDAALDQDAAPDDDDLLHHSCVFKSRAALAAALAAFAGHADFGAPYLRD